MAVDGMDKSGDRAEEPWFARRDDGGRHGSWYCSPLLESRLFPTNETGRLGTLQRWTQKLHVLLREE